MHAWSRGAARGRIYIIQLAVQIITEIQLYRYKDTAVFHQAGVPREASLERYVSALCTKSTIGGDDPLVN